MINADRPRATQTPNLATHVRIGPPSLNLVLPE
jgi:hypothetical protein